MHLSGTLHVHINFTVNSHSTLTLFDIQPSHSVTRQSLLATKRLKFDSVIIELSLWCFSIKLPEEMAISTSCISTNNSRWSRLTPYYYMSTNSSLTVNADHNDKLPLLSTTDRLTRARKIHHIRRLITICQNGDCDVTLKMPFSAFCDPLIRLNYDINNDSSYCQMLKSLSLILPQSKLIQYLMHIIDSC